MQADLNIWLNRNSNVLGWCHLYCFYERDGWRNDYVKYISEFSGISRSVKRSMLCASTHISCPSEHSQVWGLNSKSDAFNACTSYSIEWLVSLFQCPANKPRTNQEEWSGRSCYKIILCYTTITNSKWAFVRLCIEWRIAEWSREYSFPVGWTFGLWTAQATRTVITPMSSMVEGQVLFGETHLCCDRVKISIILLQDHLSNSSSSETQRHSASFSVQNSGFRQISDFAMISNSVLCATHIPKPKNRKWLFNCDW
jgi:hypothetical protein